MQDNKEKKPLDMENRNIIDSFNDALMGLIHVVINERNMKIHFVLSAITLSAAIFFGLSKLEMLILFFTITLVIFAEMINTAIEVLIDMVQKEYHPLARIAKDIAAGSVLITALNAIIVGYILFYDKIDKFSLTMITKLKTMPVHITAASIIFVVVLVIIIKYINRAKNIFKGGMPSGHSALAFSLFTSITFVSKDALISTFAFLIALIVLHSRFEAKIHSAFEVFMGAVLGILLTILVFQLTKF